MSSCLIYDKNGIILGTKRRSFFKRQQKQLYFIKKINKHITSEIIFIINDYDDLCFLFKIKDYNLNLILIVANKVIFKRLRKSENNYFPMKYFYELIKAEQ